MMWFLSEQLSSWYQRPAFAIVNGLLGISVGCVFYVLSVVLIRKLGIIAWAIGLAMLLLAVRWVYDPGFDVRGSYKESDIPDRQFAHVMFLALFGLQPVLAVVAFLGGGAREVVRWLGRKPTT